MTSSPCSGDLAAIINSGKAYQNLEATTAGKKAQEDQEHFLEKHQGKNKIALQIMNKLFKSRRLKCDIGEELYFVAQKIKELILEARKHGEKVHSQKDFACEYLEQYELIRYLQIVSTVQKMNEHFLTQKQIKAGKALSDVLLALAGRDHIQIIQTNGSAHMNSSDIDPSNVSLEPTTLQTHFNNAYETLNFQKCVFPILSDRALEPQEVTLLQSIFLNNHQNPAISGRDGPPQKIAPYRCLPYTGSA